MLIGGMLDRRGRTTVGVELDRGGIGMSAAWDTERVSLTFWGKILP